MLNFFNGWVAQWILDTVAGLSVLNHFVAITRGVVSLEDALYFASMMALWLYLTVLALEAKRRNRRGLDDCSTKTHIDRTRSAPVFCV